jgi:hypothetical protein
MGDGWQLALEACRAWPAIRSEGLLGLPADTGDLTVLSGRRATHLLVRRPFRLVLTLIFLGHSAALFTDNVLRMFLWWHAAGIRPGRIEHVSRTRVRDSEGSSSG